LCKHLESTPTSSGTGGTEEGNGRRAPRPLATPTRRRGTVLEDAILQAAVDELTKSGYGG
jgi:hypothetical protein